MLYIVIPNELLKFIYTKFTPGNTCVAHIQLSTLWWYTYEYLSLTALRP